MAGPADVVYVGQRMAYDVEFRTLKGVSADPTLVRLLARHPSGQTEILNFPSSSITKEDVGYYSAEFVVNEPGTWHFRWEGAGVVDSIIETELEVAASGVVDNIKK